ncbi:V-type proton ATPase 116 kDa subunit a2 isoform X2 [Callorhinchus milii]|uniref:V-type proton ATPase 116 kDa subunit a2 isoform X2 n=1 Tax=Callorhinchus milii TaxID=7868 RepID=UPI001C3FAF63|nr:V-type proton ATPase 116 kDa subunit a2 isoform X2 [Callorhinchus milii]
MGSLFRGETMSLAQLYLQSGSAYHCVAELGDIGLVQFRDLNENVNLFQRRFVGEIRRCEELERTLSSLGQEVHRAGLRPRVDEEDDVSAPLPRDLLRIQEESQQLQQELDQVTKSRSSLVTRLSDLRQHRAVLTETQQLLVREMALESPLTGPDQEETNRNQTPAQLPARLSFHCHLFPYPLTPDEQEETLRDLEIRTHDLQMVLSQTEGYLAQVLERTVKVIHTWSLRVRKMKAIYLVLNQCNFDVTGKCLIAEVWCPVSQLHRLRHALEEGSRRSGSSVPSFYNEVQTLHTPPTLCRTNKFTAGFQGIVDAYGVGSYQEVNPAPYTIITFPFLFAVMFGDVGHGALMFFFALWMVLEENDPKVKSAENEIWQTCFGGRYLLLLMGLFSLYTGLVYNDCFSQSLAIFPSAWHVSRMCSHVDNQSCWLLVGNQLDPNISGVVQGVYPFGIDPIWHLAINKLSFLNSFKMKMSVILGVVHMTFGVTLGFFNYIHRKQFALIVLVLLPELVFLTSLFGYLLFLVVYKWLRYSAWDSDVAPSLLVNFIDMFFFMSPSSELYHGQAVVQKVLVVLALISIPVLLLGKPLLLYCQHRARTHRHRFLGGYQSLEEANGSINRLDCDDDQIPEDEFDFADVFMHQAIHTIEYCLGCISNTASYLRLWALSLAHAQLSDVLWSMVLRFGWAYGQFRGSVILFVVFAVFATLTVTILLVMEGLSAFLHALRLHWVEFQNKFYSGSGYKFLPFSFLLLEESSL